MPPAKNPSNKPEEEKKVAEPTPASDTTPPAQNHDETDVAAALQRKTQDGKGDEEVPESDFDSFATAGVEKEPTLSIEQVTSEVLAGRWGPTDKVAAQRLEAAGYDVAAVSKEYARRKAGGAPSAF